MERAVRVNVFLCGGADVAGRCDCVCGVLEGEVCKSLCSRVTWQCECGARARAGALWALRESV